MTKVIILAAGQGKRLLPKTKNLPKCLVDLGGKPLLIKQIELLHSLGLNDISVVPNPYMSRSHFQEQDERRLRFTRLPSECQITVYTVTGELVTVIDHSDAYDSNE